MYISYKTALLRYIPAFSAFPKIATSFYSGDPASPILHIFSRQVSTTALSATPSSTTALQSSANSFVPTGTPTATNAPLSIRESLINQHLETLNVNGDTISFGCKNCSIFGDFQFAVDAFKTDFNPTNPTWPLSGGILLLNASGFGGTFELDIASGTISKTWNHTFYSQTVLGFGVCLQQFHLQLQFLPIISDTVRQL